MFTQLPEIQYHSSHVHYFVLQNDPFVHIKRGVVPRVYLYLLLPVEYYVLPCH